VDWFDGHLDLAYIALHGRDLRLPAETAGGTLQPAALTFPALRAARVTRAFSTLFVRQKTAAVSGPYCFTTPDEANSGAWEQVEMHRVWQEQGWIEWNAPTVAPPSKIQNPKSKIQVPSARSRSLKS
jgi:hypothetical protein